MATPPTLFISLLIVSTFLFSPSVSELCKAQDKKVLLEIKAAFGNHYVLASLNPSTDYCDWYTVTCDSTTNRINSLAIFSGNLSGENPAAVDDLTSLTLFDLNHLSNVTGPIQWAISKFKNMTFFQLSHLNLSGMVPSFLSQLQDSTFLDLFYNDVTGLIPLALSPLHNLNALYLDGNKLTASIPVSFGSFSRRIPMLRLSHNQLSGSIPTSLGGLGFNVLDFFHNNLNGDVSFLFGANKMTQNIYLSHNTFAFNLTKVIFPMSLSDLDLSHNKIYGSIPQKMTAVPGLELQPVVWEDPSRREAAGFWFIFVLE